AGYAGLRRPGEAGHRAERAQGRQVRSGQVSDQTSGLALDVDQVLEDLVAGGDHLRVRLETALGDDQVGELGTEVDVAHLECAAVHRAAATGGGDADLGQARVGAGPEGGVAQLLQTGRVVEGGQGDLPQRLLLPVVEDAGDDAVA